MKDNTLENEIKENKNEAIKEPLDNNANVYRNLESISRQQTLISPSWTINSYLLARINECWIFSSASIVRATHP